MREVLGVSVMGGIKDSKGIQRTQGKEERKAGKGRQAKVSPNRSVNAVDCYRLSPHHVRFRAAPHMIKPEAWLKRPVVKHCTSATVQQHDGEPGNAPARQGGRGDKQGTTSKAQQGTVVTRQ